MDTKEKSLKQLFIPIYLELLFLMLVGSVDTLMLSGVGDDAVGAVGAANTYLGVFTITFSIISSGMLAVMTQYIGAKKIGVAKQARTIGLIFNGIVGLAISVMLLFFARPILVMLGISPALLEYATTYMQLVGGTAILVAVTPIFSSYLRAFGYTKEPLIATMISNVLNIIFNAIFLYVFHMGVAGVAIATIISRIIGLVILIILCPLRIKISKEEERISTREVSEKILKIGVPSALETALYNVAMAIVMKFLNQMDSKGMYVTVKSYATQLANLSFCAGAALANANSIIVGWKIGAKKFDECKAATYKAAKIGAIVTIVFAGFFALTGRYIIRIFTQDEQIITLVVWVLVVDIFLEIGRVCNLVFGGALKTAGDATYTVTIAVVFMYLFAVLGTYILGIRMEWMIIGSWIALAMDEMMRAVLMCLRWRSEKWRSKTLVR